MLSLMRLREGPLHWRDIGRRNTVEKLVEMGLAENVAGPYYRLTEEGSAQVGHNEVDASRFRKESISLERLAAIAERAYRRGFQQGHHAAKAGVPVRDLHRWRYSLDIYAAIPPEKVGVPFPGWPSVIDRLLIEEDWLTFKTSSPR